jgi:hypothetical protein
MSCNSLNGIAKDCGPNIKGLREIYIADLSDIDTTVGTNGYTISSGNVTAINMVTSPASLFQKYEFRKTSGSNYEENQVDPTQGFDGWTQTVTLVLNRREVNKRNEIAVLAEGFRNLVVIVLDLNGTYWLFGATNGLNLTATTGGSESANYTLTLAGEEVYPAYTVSPAAVAAVLA